jgi:manganese/zinc/iron transport system substrate-binding protein
VLGDEKLFEKKVVKYFYGILLLGLLVALLTACGSESTTSSERNTNGDTLKVVTTTGQITDIVQQVGGDKISVTGLMGPGVDPHLYQASEGNVESLVEADLVFYNGLFLEAQMENIFEQMGDKAVAVSKNVDRSRLLDWAAYENAYDPHIWFDVTIWMDAVKTIENTLAERDPTNAQYYQDNATKYLAELEELHQYVQSQAQKLPEDQRILITAHDAFEYFSRAYGFEVKGLQGISTASEAGTADIQDLADFIVERQIKAIFIESSVPRRNVEAVQAAVQAKGFEVEIGGELFSDSIGSPGTPEGSYIGAVRHTVDTIVGVLSQETLP